MSQVFTFLVLFVGFTATFGNAYLENEDDVQKLIMTQLEAMIKGGFSEGFDPLRIPYLPIPLKKMDPRKSSDGYLVFTNLELRGLSKVKWNLVYNSTSMVGNLDFSVPFLKLDVVSCLLELEISEYKFGEESTYTKISGDGELRNVLEDFTVAIEFQLEERRNRLRISDLKFTILLDWCDLYWNKLIVNGESVTDWDEICDVIVVGISLLNEDYVAPYIEELLMAPLNIILLSMESSSNNLPQTVSDLGGKLVS